MKFTSFTLFSSFALLISFVVGLAYGRPQQTQRLRQQFQAYPMQQQQFPMQQQQQFFPMQQQNSIAPPNYFVPQQINQNKFVAYPTRRPIYPIYTRPDYAALSVEQFCAKILTTNSTILSSTPPMPPVAPASSGVEPNDGQPTEPDATVLDTQPTEPTPSLRMIMVVDETGSMSSYTDVTIESFNGWLNTQKSADLADEDVPPQFSLVKFDTEFSVKSWENIEDGEALDRESYKPSGGTALYDALGCVLNAYGEEEDNIVVIITDGEDNSSRKFDTGDVKELIDGLTEEKGWEFSYIGANQDPLAVSGSLGIAKGNTQSYSFSEDGFKDMYAQLATQVHASRQNQYQKRLGKGR